MRIKVAVIAALVLVFLTPGTAAAKDKQKNHAPRGMLERMESMPCGVKERGLTSLGALYAGIGIQHVNSNEKLCPQYLFRTDQMDYHIRPLDQKHPVLLPVGQEAEFKIKKDKLYLKVVDGDRKTRPYQVVSMEPVNSEAETEGTRANDHPVAPRPAANQQPQANQPSANQPPVNQASPADNQPNPPSAQQSSVANQVPPPQP